jgi:signal transduction histidine kinase
MLRVVPPRGYTRSTAGVTSRRECGGSLGSNVASHTRGQPASIQQHRELLIDAGLAVAVFAASLGLVVAGGDVGDRHGHIDALRVLLTALASLPLVARRRAPLAVFVVTGLASTALNLVAVPVGPPIGPTVALYGLAAAGDGSRARMRRVFAVVAAVLVAHASAAGLADHQFPGAQLLFGVVLWSATWLTGERARVRAERMAELEDKALRAEREADRERRLAAAEERMRIARDLHDSAGHAINVILVHAGAGRLHAGRDPDATREAFGTIEEVARETVGEIDQLVRGLRDDAPLAPDRDDVEPPPGLAALERLAARHRAAGLDVTTTVRGDGALLSPGVDRGAYRILQEALTNAARHGDGAAQVEVGFTGDTVDLTVTNALRRDRRTRNPDGGGHGLIGMRERAALLGGSFDAGARDGHFTVHARLPIGQRPT